MGAALALAVAVMAPPGRAAGTQVQMVDNEPDLTNWHFDPATLTVPVGATVVWHNRGHEDHSVTADDLSFDSGLKKAGTDFSRAFAKPGRYAYHCQPHPWMKGAVQVVAGATAAASVTNAAPTTTTTLAGAAATTFPPSLATKPSAQAGAQGSTTTQAPASTSSSTSSTSSGASAGSAAPATAKRSHSKRSLVGTLALVLIPTLGALAVGARLRRPKS
jgi:plastocyanin